MFEVYKDNAGQWRWRLIASNGRNIATSGEGYINKHDCVGIIENIKLKVGSAPITGI
ncbi:MAG: DUF1508 domain-containing protein [Ignavibacteriales bacterium]|nr:DUF1508 domain-containing protein [Ignavibacteriales bacterium]